MQQDVKLTFEELQKSEYLNGFDEPKRALAAAAVLGLTLAEMAELEESNESFYGVDAYFYRMGSQELVVLTDDEADEALEAREEELFEELIEPYIIKIDPLMLEAFDKKAWKQSFENYSRGAELSAWDGEEHEEQIDGEFFYVYREN